MVQLREINRQNFWECISLEVSKEQKSFVTSNAVSIAQSKIQNECQILAIYNKDIIVGFVMYCIDSDDDEYWIYRMMVDKKFQSKGIGDKALSLLIKKIQRDKKRDVIYLGVHKESISAVRLYKKHGFEFTGKVYGSEHIMQLRY